MKNVLLKFDGSGNIFTRIFKKCYDYAVVYEDGLISYLQSASENRKACGIVSKGHIIFFANACQKTPNVAKEELESQVLFGRKVIIPPFSAMKKLFTKREKVNEIITQLGGRVLENNWHMCINDYYADSSGNASFDVCGLHPLADVNTLYISDGDELLWLYPAVKI